MKKFMTKQNGIGLMMLLVAVVMMIMPQFAFAAEGMSSGVSDMMKNSTFQTIISFGLGIFAAWKWFNYFANFNPSSAFTEIIVPAVITFLAFKWQTVIGWFGF